jgi:flagellum-specific peptidoglycan hydrolase FlgJ
MGQGYQNKHHLSQEQIEEAVYDFSIGVWGAKAVIPGDWDYMKIAASIYENCSKYNIDPVLALAQGVVECHFGVAPTAKRSRRTKNIFNVGNVDSGADEAQASWEKGIERYCRLMASEYNWKPGGPVTLQMMVDHDFVRPRGGRYATAKNYTEMVEQVAQKIVYKLKKLMPWEVS